MRRGKGLKIQGKHADSLLIMGQLAVSEAREGFL